jgi:hypothetical protein
MLIGPGLSAICAAAARNGRDDLDLFAGTWVLDKVPDVDDAISAGVRAQALEAGVVRLYSVVGILGGWVCVGCARLCGGHGVLSLGPGPGRWCSAGPFPLSELIIHPWLTPRNFVR